ncbi:MAG: NlpC/P60 family protein [Flavihumibacter sp.]
MSRIFGVIGLTLLLAACGSTRTATGPGATVKRTVTHTPTRSGSVSMAPGGDPEGGPGYNGAPNTGRLSGPKYAGNGAYANIENSTALQFKYAVLMNQNVEDLWNTELLQFIDDWYGTRYRFGGNSRDGIDCSAFTCQLSSAMFNKTLPRTSREQYDRCQHIPNSQLQTGDLVFFKNHGGVSHVGVYLLNNKFVHASTSAGVTISDLNEEYYRKRYMGAGRF